MKFILLFSFFSFLTTNNTHVTKGIDDPCSLYFKAENYYNENDEECYMNPGSVDSTIVMLKIAEKEGCNKYELYELLYYCYEQNENYLEAHKYVSLAISKDTSKHELYYGRGEINMHNKNLTGALRDYQTYISFEDAQYLQTGYYRCGAISYALNDTTLSNNYMKKATKLNNGESLRDFHSYCISWGMISE